MSERDDGGPAFPMPMAVMSDTSPHIACEPEYGMTLRDYFAAKSMQGTLSNTESLDACHRVAKERNADPFTLVAISAYQMADTMLKARQS